MSSYSDHIAQAKNNLTFLESVNTQFPKVYDWQVTIAFYAALHLVNGHVKKTMGVYHTTHKDLAQMISPQARIKSPAQLSEDAFVAYEALFILSRRARYLYSVKQQKKPSFTYHKHLAKAIRHLNTVMSFLDNQHQIGFEKIKISCAGLKQGELYYFDT